MPIRLRDVIKSSEVEDPINRYVHRPLQLLLVRPLSRTSITPNQVTFCSLLCGLGSAAAIVYGTQNSLWLGAVLLFASAIIDGVDGMLARLRKSGSEIGHALDGASDYIVNLATTGAAVYHLAQKTGHVWLSILLGLAAHWAWAHHLMLYDYHCAMYLRHATLGKHTGGQKDNAQKLLADMRARNESWFRLFIMSMYVWQLGNRERFLQRVVPSSIEAARFVHDAETSTRYTQSHKNVMQMWAWLGNAPHMDGMVIATFFDRFDLYFLVRIVGFSALGIMAALSTRRVSLRFRAKP